MRCVILLAAVFFAIPCLADAPTSAPVASSDEVEAMRAQIEQIRQLLDKLEARLNALAGPPGKTAAPSVDDGAYVVPGMSLRRANQIFGSQPTTIANTPSGMLVRWRADASKRILSSQRNETDQGSFTYDAVIEDDKIQSIRKYYGRQSGGMEIAPGNR